MVILLLIKKSDISHLVKAHVVVLFYIVTLKYAAQSKLKLSKTIGLVKQVKVPTRTDIYVWFRNDDNR